LSSTTAATYFAPGWFINHVIAEVWDSAAQRWWPYVRHNLVHDLAALATPRAGHRCRSLSRDCGPRSVLTPGHDDDHDDHDCHHEPEPYHHGAASR
jgi:hypothetical protein